MLKEDKLLFNGLARKEIATVILQKRKKLLSSYGRTQVKH